MLVVGLAAVVGCGGISKEQYNAKEAEAAKYKQSTQDQSAKAAALESKVTSLEQQNATLQSQVGDLEKKVNESTAARQEMQAKAPVRVNERMLFKENSSVLTPESKRALDAVAQAIHGSKDRTVIVSGYTDDSEAAGKDSRAKRWQLSSARAVAVAKYLAGRGLDPSLIGVAGFGQARPVAPNDSLANKTLNRRVEIVLMPVNLSMSTIDVKPAELTPKK
jgi:chemotaxis protein MotB